ncbi:UNVERIFIED_CONTAM: hypothetical protein Sradi_1121200 [Sesamum radiatum]|uniref:Uncharacterized protein n=1 Tax=Sesamum radiatum TaxID=300843 RepID=A0AAW2VA39_SESRA
MNPSKIEEAIFHNLGPPHQQVMGPHPAIDDDAFSLPEIDLFHDDDDDVSHTSSDAEVPHPLSSGVVQSLNPNLPNPPFVAHNKRPIHRPSMHVSPEPHISSQFYTFNKESHALMTQCLVEGRLATPEEIRAPLPAGALQLAVRVEGSQ